MGEETNTPSYIYKAAVVNENQALDFLWMGNGESSSRETTDGVADEDCRWKIEVVIMSLRMSVNRVAADCWFAGRQDLPCQASRRQWFGSEVRAAG